MYIHKRRPRISNTHTILVMRILSLLKRLAEQGWEIDDFSLKTISCPDNIRCFDIHARKQGPNDSFYTFLVEIWDMSGDPPDYDFDTAHISIAIRSGSRNNAEIVKEKGHVYKMTPAEVDRIISAISPYTEFEETINKKQY
jgi:hypothetical protein